MYQPKTSSKAEETVSAPTKGSLARHLGACLLALSIIPAATQTQAITLGECGTLIRPKIETFDDYNSFMVEIIEYKKSKRICDKLILEAAKNAEEDRPNKDKIIISKETGLEDINRAVHNAKTFEHPTYREPLRFDRTTSQSFALPKIRTLDMSDYYVEGALDDTAAGGVGQSRALSEKELRETQFAQGTIQQNIELDYLVHDAQNPLAMLDRERVDAWTLQFLKSPDGQRRVLAFVGGNKQAYDELVELCGVRSAQVCSSALAELGSLPFVVDPEIPGRLGTVSFSTTFHD